MIGLNDWQAAFNNWQSANGKWILIQHRNGPKVGEFENNGWSGYKRGFGSETGNGNYWMGLEKLHNLTSRGNWDLLLNYRHETYGAATLICRHLRVESELVYYRWNLDSCGDLITHHSYYNDYPKYIMELNHAYFTTKDKDSDSDKDNCAKARRGGFWYKGCMSGSPPTGYYGGYFAEAKMAISPHTTDQSPQSKNGLIKSQIVLS